MVYITTGADRILFYVNLLVPVFLSLRAGANKDDPIQKKRPEFIPTQEVILRGRSNGFIR